MEKRISSNHNQPSVTNSAEPGVFKPVWHQASVLSRDAKRQLNAVLIDMAEGHGVILRPRLIKVVLGVVYATHLQLPSGSYAVETREVYRVTGLGDLARIWS